MKLSKKLQLGILFTLYLTRSGRTTAASASEGLGVSRNFLEQIALKLKIGGVLNTIKGPGGGYELKGEPTVLQVFNVLGPVNLLTHTKPAVHEYRALSQLSNNLRAALMPVLNRKIKNVGAELVASDMNRMARISPSARTN